MMKHLKSAIVAILVALGVSAYFYGNYFVFKKVHPEATVKQWLWSLLR